MDTLITNIGQLVSPCTDGLEMMQTPCSLKVSQGAQLMIRNGRIANLPAHRSGLEHQVIDAGGRVVMPGLIDPFWALPALPAWVLDADDPVYEGMDLLAWGRRLLNQMLRSGVTTVEVKCAYDSDLQGLSALGHLEQQRHPRVLGALLASLSDHSSTRERQVSSLIGEIIPEIRHRKLATFCDIGWEGTTDVIADASTVLRAAIGAGLRPKLHMKTSSQPGDVVDLACGLEVAAVGCASHVSMESAAQLAEGHITPVYLPVLAQDPSNERLRIRPLLDRGFSVALGSGNGLIECAPSSMWSVITAAMDRMGLSLQEAIWTCTLGNSRAMELSHETGSLEMGKRADLLLLDVADYRELYTAQGHPPVSMVMIGGEIAWQI